MDRVAGNRAAAASKLVGHPRGAAGHLLHNVRRPREPSTPLVDNTERGAQLGESRTITFFLYSALKPTAHTSYSTCYAPTAYSRPFLAGGLRNGEVQLRRQSSRTDWPLGRGPSGDNRRSAHRWVNRGFLVTTDAGTTADGLQ